MRVQRQRIKNLYKKLGPPRPLGSLYWENCDPPGGVFRLPTMAEWETIDAAFSAIEKRNPYDDSQLDRWSTFCKEAATGDLFKTDKEQAERDGIALVHIPLYHHGAPCIKGLYEGPTGEFTSVLRLYGDNVEFYRGTPK